LVFQQTTVFPSSWLLLNTFFSLTTCFSLNNAVYCSIRRRPEIGVELTVNLIDIILSIRKHVIWQ
jgi:hypothetical protein